MKKVVKVFPWIVAVVALAMLSGCAAVCGVEEKAPTPPPAPAPAVVQPVPVTEKPEPAPALPTTYTVEECDDLWSIAAKPQIYDDAWLWPLLWDANKAQISDANKLTKGIVLTIPRDVSDADKAAARETAHKFPKFVLPAGMKSHCPPK